MKVGRIWSGVFPSKRRSCISVRSTTTPGMRFSIPISNGRMSCFSARSVDISATCSRLRYAKAGSFLSMMSAIANPQNTTRNGGVQWYNYCATHPSLKLRRAQRMAVDLKALKTQFLEYIEIEKGRSVKTVENYDRYLNRFLQFAKVKSPAQ